MSTLPVHDPIGMRHAGRDLLSLALLDARNQTLRWLSVFDDAGGIVAGIPPLWLAGQAAWLQECWIGRHVHRQRGASCDPFVPRLASIEVNADRWFGLPPDPSGDMPGKDDVRSYLAATLETTLELLDTANEDDDGLYFFRLALWHEDRLPELFASIAQAAESSEKAQRPMWPTELPVYVPRPELHVPALAWQLGSAASAGFVPEAEGPVHAVAVDAFDIDAQPVTWSQYAEFVDDGGYDDLRWWTEAGQAWLSREGRRVPRHVEQLRNGVLLHRAGGLQRVNPQQSAVHLSAHEADAWCAWAGRRLPTEAEWEAAVMQAKSLGTNWGSVNEWMLGSARPYPGHEAGPVPLSDLLLDWPGAGRPGLRVQRGASWLTSARRRHPKSRRFVSADDDSMFCGFRSCAW